MIDNLANGYSSESTQLELSNEYQHDRVQMIFTNLCILVLWPKVALALEGLKRYLSVYSITVMLVFSGLCIERPSGPITCHCQPGWNGPTCSEVDNLCLYGPCKNGSTCNDISGANGPGRYNCTCVPGFTGKGTLWVID